MQPIFCVLLASYWFQPSTITLESRLADAILDRNAHHAHQISINGKSTRRTKTLCDNVISLTSNYLIQTNVAFYYRGWSVQMRILVRGDAI